MRRRNRIAKKKSLSVGGQTVRNDLGMALERTFYQDPWNDRKVWEVVRMIGAYYLRQYIDGRQVNIGVKMTKKFIKSLGILDFEKATIEL